MSSTSTSTSTSTSMSTSTFDFMLDKTTYVNMERFNEQIAAFGISNGFVSLLYKTGAVLAGGAITNYVYNTIHPDKKIPMHPDSDIDIWVYDPMMNMTIDASHAQRAYKHWILSEFNKFFLEAGMVVSSGPVNSPDTYSDLLKEFNTQGGTKIKCNWWINKTTGKRIQLMFMNKPPSEAVLLFDLTVCRCFMHSSESGSLYWKCSNDAKRDISANQLTIPKIMTKNTNSRIEKYVERYGFTLVEES